MYNIVAQNKPSKSEEGYCTFVCVCVCVCVVCLFVDIYMHYSRDYGVYIIALGIHPMLQNLVYTWPMLIMEQ